MHSKPNQANDKLEMPDAASTLLTHEGLTLLNENDKGGPWPFNWAIVILFAKSRANNQLTCSDACMQKQVTNLEAGLSMNL